MRLTIAGLHDSHQRSSKPIRHVLCFGNLLIPTPVSQSQCLLASAVQRLDANPVHLDGPPPHPGPATICRRASVEADVGRRSRVNLQPREQKCNGVAQEPLRHSPISRDNACKGPEGVIYIPLYPVYVYIHYASLASAKGTHASLSPTTPRGSLARDQPYTPRRPVRLHPCSIGSRILFAPPPGP
ncbi:hypothetical protein GQ53DRAFT_181267 [Thozetella sp. PMI_491]|nr:hypothetical protein GQ53DRAFT_181267 [Thozetella sp. PMI_491]